MNSQLRTADNKTQVLVASAQAAHGLSPDASVAAGLADGVVAVVNPDMTVIANLATAEAAGTPFFIVQGTGVGKALKVSPLFDPRKSNYTISKGRFQAETNQVTYIGYNGSAGAIDAADASTTYVITLIMTNPNAGDRSQPSRRYGVYTSPATGASDEDTTLNLVTNLIANDSHQVDDNILVERVVSDAATNTEWDNVAIATGNATFTKGSKTVTMTDTSNLVAGHWFRVGTSATEALTDPAYKIASIDSGTQITLDLAYQGATATIDDAWIHNVGATPGDFGIKLTGKDRTFDVVQNRNHYKTRFTVTVNESLGLITTSTKAFEGKGNPNQVAMDYYEGEGFEGISYTLGTPPPNNRLSVPTALTGEYGQMHVTFKNSVPSIVEGNSLQSNLIVYLEYSDGSVGTDGDVSSNGDSIIGTSDTDYDAA